MKSLFSSDSKLHWIKNLYLRYKYGAGCCDIYSADDYLAKKILPVLKEFRKNVNSYPFDFSDCGQWQTVIDEMIWAFEYDDSYIIPFEKHLKDSNRRQFGFELFGMYFTYLWK